jgi:trans-aconitate methyltransferase
MAESTSYVLGQTARAARRLEIQDRQFAEPSERLLDDLALRPDDQVVELGCGPGSFTRRILARLGPAGVVVGVDSGADMLEHAKVALAGAGPDRFQPTDVRPLVTNSCNARIGFVPTALTAPTRPGPRCLGGHNGGH